MIEVAGLKVWLSAPGKPVVKRLRVTRLPRGHLGVPGLSLCV